MSLSIPHRVILFFTESIKQDDRLSGIAKKFGRMLREKYPPVGFLVRPCPVA
jgi:hypothetical protein